MRSLTVAAQSKILDKLGTEPINIISIDWTGDGSISWYSDKDLSLSGQIISGLILEITDVNTAINIRNTTTSSVDVQLDDTNGVIKGILDQNDAHKVEAVVYQFFEGLTFDDKFEIFRGQVSSPLIWNEGDRTVGLTILSTIEDREVGFSPEESELTFVGKKAEGQAWPLCFGNVVHVPSTLVASQQGILKEDLCAVDQLLWFKLDSLRQAYFAQYAIVFFFQKAIEGAKLLAPAAIEILEDYIVVIKEEDRILIQLFNEKRALELAKRDRGVGVFQALFNQIIANHQNNIAQLAIQFGVVANLKEILEKNTELAKEERKIIKDLSKKMGDAINSMHGIIAEYNIVREQICKQQKCIKQSIMVEDGAELGTNEIIIKGTRWLGSWDGDKFTIDAGPLALYTNVELDTHPGGINECDEDSDLHGMANFRLAATESDKSLKDMYALVTRRGESFRHIIKITDQEGLDCTFQLIAPKSGNQGGNSSGGGMIKGYTGPIYNTPFGFIGPDPALNPKGNGFNVCDEQISDEVLFQLGLISALDLTKKEIEVINHLECLAGKPTTSPVFVTPSPRTSFTIVGQDIDSIVEVAAVPLRHWFYASNGILIDEVPAEAFWMAPAGTPVLHGNNSCDIYVANILPSTIKAVYAYRDFEGRSLVQVPSSYYVKNESEDIGPITITSIRFPMPLGSMGEGWEDQIYVTLDSSVGPNVVDIMEHIIDTYLPDKSYDPTSFTAVKNKFKSGGDELYPANFALFDRPNASQLLGDIAWQARCGLLEKGNTFYLTYLAETPTPVATITESDVMLGSMSVETTDTENIVTKFVANWQEDYLPKKGPRQVILRHNVKKYGKHENEFNFFIYNIRELVEKSATFWLIRYANTWKRIKFNTKLNNLEVETMDAITLDFNTPYISTLDAKIVIEQSTYNSDNNSIAIEAWTPVKTGTLVEYPFAWPASADSDASFPTSEEITLEYAGGDGIAKSVTTVEGC